MLSLRNLSKRFANGGETLPCLRGWISPSPRGNLPAAGAERLWQVHPAQPHRGPAAPRRGEIWLGDRLDTLPVDERPACAAAILASSIRTSTCCRP